VTLTQADLQSGTVRAEATDLLTGKIEQLTTRLDSHCHFFQPFQCGGYGVRLRVDWKDLDAHGNPLLDADFYDLVTDKPVKKMKAHAAHHTRSRGDGIRAYDWELADASMRLQVVLIWTRHLSATVKTSASISLKVTRARDIREQSN
jgi:hypothetical protein